MSVPADRSDPRKLAERFVDTEEGVVLIEDGARGLRPATHFEIELRAGLLAALDREAAADDALQNLAADHYFARAEKAEARAEAAEKALREIDEVAPDDMDEGFACGRHDEPDHDHEFYWELWDNASQVGMQKIAEIARSALAAAAGSEEA